MLAHRVIPALLLSDGGLVKTRRFRDPVYLGDPINVIKIFNNKEVDELIVLDIDASPNRKVPDMDAIRLFADECFMPVCYGGGIRSVVQVEEIIRTGIEKVSFNTAALENPSLLSDAARAVGSSSVVGSMDVSRDLLGRYRVHTARGRKNTGTSPEDHARRMEDLGCGEILINSIDRDGTMEGYDTALISRVAKAVNVPIIALGGAGSIDHLAQGVQAGAQAVAAGSMFVFQGVNRAVLISYPPYSELERRLVAA